MSTPFGEVVEVYSGSAVIQMQRIEVTLGSGLGHYVNVTIAPKIDGKVNFEQKQVIQLRENSMVNFAMVLMAVKSKSKVIGSKSNNLTSKSMYINANENDTTNIIIYVKSPLSTQKASIVFYDTERYVLLRVLLTQLAKNSLGYPQSVNDVIAIIKSLG